VRHARHGTGVAQEEGCLVAARQVPHPHRPVTTGGGNAATVGAVRHSGDRTGVAAKNLEPFAARRIRHPHAVVLGDPAGCLAVRREWRRRAWGERGGGEGAGAAGRSTRPTPLPYRPGWRRRYTARRGCTPHPRPERCAPGGRGPPGCSPRSTPAPTGRRCLRR